MLPSHAPTTPASVDALVADALAKAHVNDLDRALEDLDQAVILDRSDARIYLLRSHIKSRQGNLDGSTADFRRAIYLDPSLDRSRLELPGSPISPAHAEEALGINASPKGIGD